MILLAPASGDGGDGGGGAGDSGGGSDKPGGDGATKTGLNEDQINAIITKTVTRQIKEFAAKQTTAQEAFATTLTEKLLGSLDEKLKDFKVEPPAGGKKDPPADITQTTEFKKLQKQLEDQGKKLTEAEAERNKERAAKRQSDFNRSVEAQLAKLGIQDPEGARILLEARKRVKFVSDDSDDVAYFKDKDDDGGDLSEGLTEWSRSAEGKRFMPASGASGSGERPRGGRDGSGGTGKTGGQGLTEAAVGESIAGHFGIPLS